MPAQLSTRRVGRRVLGSLCCAGIGIGLTWALPVLLIQLEMGPRNTGSQNWEGLLIIGAMLWQSIPVMVVGLVVGACLRLRTAIPITVLSLILGDIIVMAWFRFDSPLFAVSMLLKIGFLGGWMLRGRVTLSESGRSGS